VEGFSTPRHPPASLPLYGGRNEFVFLALFLFMAGNVHKNRKKFESSVRSIFNTTNNYQIMKVQDSFKSPSMWK
jgi:hypothetical protein